MTTHLSESGVPYWADGTGRGALPRITSGPRPYWPAIAGVDLSMTNTGVVVSHYAGLDGCALDRIQTKPVQSGKDAKGKPAATWADRHNRLGLITAGIQTRVPARSLVFMEAPAYGATGSGTFDRSGLWWRVFAALVDQGCRVVPVSPAQRAMYATGKGGGKDAGKDAVIAAVTRRYPWLDVTDNNVADALVLMAMARRAAGDPMDQKLIPEGPAYIPAANLKALDKLEEI